MDEVAGGSDYVVIKRSGYPVAAIVRPEDAALLERAPANPDRPIGALALVGGWRDVLDDRMDEWIVQIYEDRSVSTGQGLSAVNWFEDDAKHPGS